MSVMPLPIHPTTTMLDALLTPGVLSTRFQPIVEIRDGACRLFAFECLTRGPAGTNFASAEVLFEYARRKGGECMIDRACIAQALATGSVLDGCDLTLNVHASTLGRDGGFVRELDALVHAVGLTPARIIVEIVEHAPVLNRRDFLASLRRLRARGYRIALDDVGLGHSNFKMMIDSVPDYLKIDRHFAHGSAADPFRAAVVEAITGFARRVDARVVAEGVEEESDFDFLRTLGVDLFQGYYFARPMTLDDAESFRTNPQPRRTDAQQEKDPARR